MKPFTERKKQGETVSASRLPLNTIRVLDLSRILAGPWATQMLADLGAKVIKVEKPGEGDDTRRWGPPFLTRHQQQMSAYYLAANRGKYSVEIDISSAQGQAQIKKLVCQSDVLVENYKLGGLKKYGLDYLSLKRLNPRLIYCSITGFGQSGPNAERAGYDAMIQASAGLMSITGEADGTPQKVGVAVTDLMAGMYAVSAIQAALLQREQTGEGSHLDVALFDTQVAWLANQGMNYLVSGEVPKRHGTGHPNIVPYQVFAVSDGHLMLAVGNDAQFSRLCELMGNQEWAQDPLFATNAMRVENRTMLVSLLERHFIRDTLDNWLSRLSEAQIPCGPINTLDRVFDDPQVHARNLVSDLHHPTLGSIPGIRYPVRFNGELLPDTKAPPVVGEDSEEILSALQREFKEI